MRAVLRLHGRFSRKRLAASAAGHPAVQPHQIVPVAQIHHGVPDSAPDRDDRRTRGQHTRSDVGGPLPCQSYWWVSWTDLASTLVSVPTLCELQLGQIRSGAPTVVIASAIHHPRRHAARHAVARARSAHGRQAARCTGDAGPDQAAAVHGVLADRNTHQGHVTAHAGRDAAHVGHGAGARRLLHQGTTPFPCATG